jgi:hypothetical protein
MEPALPRQVKTATECATALDRGDKERARRLAEQGLALATETGDTRWIRRFEHLLKLAKGVPIEGAPYEPPSCSFCLEKGPRNVVAGPKAFICDECVKRCFTQHLDGSALSSAEPVFAAQVYCICSKCVQVCVDLAASRE